MSTPRSETVSGSDPGAGTEPPESAEPVTAATEGPAEDPTAEPATKTDTESDTKTVSEPVATPIFESLSKPADEPEAKPAATTGATASRPPEDDEPFVPVLPPIRPSPRARARRVRTLIVLACVAVVLLAGTVVAAVGAMAARGAGAHANQAFVDSAATAEVIGQVTTAVTTVYSYDYKSLPATETAAQAVITGKFATEFGRVFEPVKQLAPAQQATLQTFVRAAGVRQLQGDRAQLLMMVDQTGERGAPGAPKEPTGATARLVVDAKKIDGRWKISEVTPE